MWGIKVFGQNNVLTFAITAFRNFSQFERNLQKRDYYENRFRFQQSFIVTGHDLIKWYFVS